MIDEKRLIGQLASERTKAYIAYEMERGYWDKGYKDGLEFALKKINEQPKVGEWIPVEERLPKHYGQYLITAINDCGGVYMDVSYYDSQYKSFSPDGVEDDIAIAWMDLPKMYEVKE